MLEMCQCCYGSAEETENVSKHVILTMATVYDRLKAYLLTHLLTNLPTFYE